MEPKQTPSSKWVEAAMSVWQETGTKAWIPVVGHSMRPLLSEGDALLVDFRPQTISPGQVVVFRRDADLIAHRVIEIDQKEKGEHIVTKGDNCMLADGNIAPHAIVGPVIAVRRGAEIWPIDAHLRRGRLIATLSAWEAVVFTHTRRMAKRIWPQDSVPGSRTAVKIIHGGTSRIIRLILAQK